jgi:hypothetical protein
MQLILPALQDGESIRVFFRRQLSFRYRWQLLLVTLDPILVVFVKEVDLWPSGLDPRVYLKELDQRLGEPMGELVWVGLPLNFDPVRPMPTTPSLST